MFRSIAVILFSLCLFSCNVGFHGLHKVKPPRPQVVLKNGTVIDAKKVEFQTSFFTNKIVTDDTSWYYGRDVARYGDNVNTYVNVGDSRFAKMFMYGKINVYKIEKYSNSPAIQGGRFAGMGGGKGYSVTYFLQSGDSGIVHTFRYRYINAMIPASAPEKLMLKQFKHTRRLTSLGIYLGSTLLPASIAYTAVQGDNHPESNWVGPVGAAMITTFTAATIISIAKKIRNHQKLFNIIEKYNGY